MYLIDTNIHAAYLLQNFEGDKVTKLYLSLYDTITLSERVVPDFILGEFETLIMKVVPARYGLNSDDKQKLKRTAQDYIKSLTEDCTIVVPEVRTVQRARNLYFENMDTHYISFVDCLVLATAEQNNYAIFTKDERLSTLAKKLTISLHQPQSP
jgi:predicted nucleic acid-binding protein